MKRSIWKYEIPVRDKPCTHEMPANTTIVHVAGQWERPTLWAIVDTEAELVERTFVITGTGHPADDGKYVGSALCGPYVWHVWELLTDGSR